MTLPPDQIMPLVVLAGSTAAAAAPSSSLSSSSWAAQRFYLRLGDMILGDILHPRQPPASHPIPYKHALVVEVGPEDLFHVYLEIPAWHINGVDIGNYSAAEYLGSARAPTTDNPNNRANLANWRDFNRHIRRVDPLPFFKWDLGDGSRLNPTLAALRQNRLDMRELEPKLTSPPPMQLVRAEKPWKVSSSSPSSRDYKKYQQQQRQLLPAAARKIDCTVEIVDRTANRAHSATDARIRATLDNQHPWDRRSTFDEVLAHVLQIPVSSVPGGTTTTHTLEKMLAQTQHALELWVLPQKFEGAGILYEWKKASGWVLGVFLDDGDDKGVVAKEESPQLFIEAHITQGKAKVVELG
jgi:hypothetical protein